MFLLNFESMQKIRDAIIAETQSFNFHSKMAGVIFNRYPHLWRFAEGISNEMEMKYDRSNRKWYGYHKDLSKRVCFDTKPNKSQKVLQTLWGVSREVSKGNPKFTTIMNS